LYQKIFLHGQNVADMFSIWKFMYVSKSDDITTSVRVCVRLNILSLCVGSSWNTKEYPISILQTRISITEKNADAPVSIAHTYNIIAFDDSIL